MYEPVPRRLPGKPFPGCNQPLAGEQELSGERVDSLFAFIPAGCNCDVGRVLILEDVVTEFVGGREPATARWAVRADDSDTHSDGCAVPTLQSAAHPPAQMDRDVPLRSRK